MSMMDHEAISMAMAIEKNLATQNLRYEDSKSEVVIKKRIKTRSLIAIVIAVILFAVLIYLYLTYEKYEHDKK
jgi:nitric oxide reductase large subunit